MSLSLDYAAALARITDADLAVTKLAGTLHRFAESMERFPGATCFSDIENEPAPPLGELMDGPRWYAPDFPTAENLQAALRERLEARREAKRIFNKMSFHERKGLPKVPA